jgi:hypothetical protein
MGFDGLALEQLEIRQSSDGFVPLKDSTQIVIVVKIKYPVAATANVNLATIRPAVHGCGIGFKRVLRRKIRGSSVDHDHGPNQTSGHLAMPQFFAGR